MSHVYGGVGQHAIPYFLPDVIIVRGRNFLSPRNYYCGQEIRDSTPE